MIRNNLWPKFFLLFIYSLAALFLAGCGYTTRSMLQTQYNTIFITPFVNKIDFTRESDVGNKYKIYRPMLETEITKAVIDRYILDGNLRPVKLPPGDLILKGELLEFRRDPLRYDSSDNVLEYRLNIVVNISLWDDSTHKMLWEENGFTGDTTYFTSGDQAVSEDVAVSAALKDLARRIVERTVEQW